MDTAWAGGTGQVKGINLKGLKYTQYGFQDKSVVYCDRIRSGKGRERKPCAMVHAHYYHTLVLSLINSFDIHSVS